MKQRKNNRIAGFSLLEVVVGIALLGLVTVPICASLILSVRMNAHSQALMNAQLQASGMVESLLAEGIVIDDEEGMLNGIPKKAGEEDVWSLEDSNIEIQLAGPSNGYYDVTVTATAGSGETEKSVTLKTSVREGGGS